MRESLEKKYDKFEEKKRSKLGDEAFLKKYTKSYATSKKILKICIPLLLVLSPLNAVLFFLSYNKSGSTFDYSIAFLWVAITILWSITAFMYYKYHFKIIDQRIEKWNGELSALNNNDNGDIKAEPVVEPVIEPVVETAVENVETVENVTEPVIEPEIKE